MENGNQPAFNVCENTTMKKSAFDPDMCYGLTKREHYAGLAMQGLLANPARLELYLINGFHIEPKELASDAVACADALLTELSKQKP